MNKTIIITGASQGTGLAIALRFAASGANVVIAAKDTPDQIGQAADQVVAAGGQVLARCVDVCNHNELQQLVADTVAQFGGIDILVNNTSAIFLIDSLHTSPERFDLMMSTSVRAAFFLSQMCFPHLKNAPNPHIINIAPPLNPEAKWLKDHLGFSIAKYAMSLCTMGMAAEFQQAGIAVNALWPQTNIATQRLKDHLAPAAYRGSRHPSIMADAAYELAHQSAREVTGQFLIDETFLRELGIVDFSQYAIDPTAPPMSTLFVPIQEGMTQVSRELFLSK